MEVNDDLLIRAIEQAIASISLEFDSFENIEKIEIDKQKLLILKGNKNCKIRNLCYR